MKSKPRGCGQCADRGYTICYVGNSSTSCELRPHFQTSRELSSGPGLLRCTFLGVKKPIKSISATDDANQGDRPVEDSFECPLSTFSSTALSLGIRVGKIVFVIEVGICRKLEAEVAFAGYPLPAAEATSQHTCTSARRALEFECL